MRTQTSLLALAACVLVCPPTAISQTFATDDPVIERMWEEGIGNSQTQRLAQALMDSIGPRLAGSPEFDAAGVWLLAMYGEWGVPARKEEYGTWRGWRQGTLHVDLVAPRVQTLEAELLAYSPGNGGPVEGEVVVVPPDLSVETLPQWLETVAGKFVLTAPPEPMCRAPQELERFARAETVERVDSLRSATAREYWDRVRTIAGGRRAGVRALEDAGAAGILTSRWSGGWGVNKVFDTGTRSVPAVDLSCEDYGLLFRMADRGQAPRIRMDARSEDLGEVPQFNIIAEIRGSELPDEYIVLSAHLDSWHAGTGATDNGTGTITMLEAMRILNETYPSPRRSIIVGHWGAEEMGLIGSRSFVEDHPAARGGSSGSRDRAFFTRESTLPVGSRSSRPRSAATSPWSSPGRRTTGEATTRRSCARGRRHSGSNRPTRSIDSTPGTRTVTRTTRSCSTTSRRTRPWPRCLRMRLPRIRAGFPATGRRCRSIRTPENPARGCGVAAPGAARDPTESDCRPARRTACMKTESESP